MSNLQQQKTSLEYSSTIKLCKTKFVNKLADYGLSWRILRASSLTDQIYIKAQRIRTIQIKKKQMVEDHLDDEFIGIVNYSVIALIQIEKGFSDTIDNNKDWAIRKYDDVIANTQKLMLAKNHDYNEAWRSLRISSITDLIYQKVLRIKQIEHNNGKTKVSEGIDANYRDIINYSIFALILSKK